jgi:hypothetical protein
MLLRLTGEGCLVGDDGEVLLRPAKSLLLLAYLALAERPTTREALGDLFWPGGEREPTLQALRQTLHRLRALLGEDQLELEGRYVALRPTTLRIDLPIRQAEPSLEDLLQALEGWREGFLTGIRVQPDTPADRWLGAEYRRVSGQLRQWVLGFVRQARFEGRGKEAQRLLELALRVFPEDLTLAQAAEELAQVAAIDPKSPSSHRHEVSSLKLPSPGVSALAASLAALLLLALGILYVTPLRTVTLTAEQPFELPDHLLLTCNEAGASDLAGFERSYRLYRMELDGSKRRPLTTQDNACEVAWLPEAGGMVTRSYRGRSGSYFFLTPDPDDPSGPWNSRTLGSLAGMEFVYLNGFGLPPAEVDGRYVVVAASVPGGTPSLYLLDPVADTARRLTDDAGEDEGAHWYEPTREVLFSSNRTGVWNLWALRLEGPEPRLRQLTQSPSRDTRPNSNPQGQVAFVRGFGEGDFEGDMAIHLLDPTTGEEQLLQSNPWNELDPHWSPDGRFLCYKSEEFGHFESDLWVLDMETGRRVNLTPPPMSGRAHECRWLPDSQEVVFILGDGPRNRIVRMRRDGSAWIEITGETDSAGPQRTLERRVLEPAGLPR